MDYLIILNQKTIYDNHQNLFLKYLYQFLQMKQNIFKIFSLNNIIQSFFYINNSYLILIYLLLKNIYKDSFYLENIINFDQLFLL